MYLSSFCQKKIFKRVFFLMEKYRIQRNQALVAKLRYRDFRPQPGEISRREERDQEHIATYAPIQTRNQRASNFSRPWLVVDVRAERLFLVGNKGLGLIKATIKELEVV